MLKTYFAVMLGGALGTGVRMAISTWSGAKFGEQFPVGTLLVNVSGCFVIGFFAAFCGPEGGVPASPLIRQIVMIGFLGGYTTFSSFGLQTLDLLQQGHWFGAGLNASLSFALCLLAVWLGQLLALAFPSR